MDLLLPGIESFRSPEIENALELLAKSGETERGAIFTRKIVVDAILDLSGYFPSGNLSNERILEPSFGGGDFLLPIIERLLCSYRVSKGRLDNACQDLLNCIVAVEVHTESHKETSDISRYCH